MKTVLLVEDDPTLLRLEEQVVRDAGYDAESVPDAQGARTKAKATPYAGIVFDVTVSGSEGYATALQLSGLDANRFTPLIIVGSNEPDARRRAFDAGAMAFLAKPFTAEAFRSVVHSVLSPAGPRPAAARRAPAKAPVRVSLNPPAAPSVPAPFAPGPAETPPPARSAASAGAGAIPVSFQGGAVYWCEPDEGGWRCGRCETGLIAAAEAGAPCNVCHAEVVLLEESSRGGFGWLIVLVLLGLAGVLGWALLSGKLGGLGE